MNRSATIDGVQCAIVKYTHSCCCLVKTVARVCSRRVSTWLVWCVYVAKVLLLGRITMTASVRFNLYIYMVARWR